MKVISLGPVSLVGIVICLVGMTVFPSRAPTNDIEVAAILVGIVSVIVLQIWVVCELVKLVRWAR